MPVIAHCLAPLPRPHHALLPHTQPKLHSCGSDRYSPPFALISMAQTSPRGTAVRMKEERGPDSQEVEMGNHACHDLRHLLGPHMSGQRTYRGNCSRIEGPQKGRGLAWQCTLSACLLPPSPLTHTSLSCQLCPLLERPKGVCFPAARPAHRPLPGAPLRSVQISHQPLEQLRCPCSVSCEP